MFIVVESFRNARVALVLTSVILLGFSGCGSSTNSEASTAAATSKEWFSQSLTDTSGATFNIGQLAGKPVFVENFATWCSNCRRQLGDTQKAAKQAGDSAIFLALSVETDLDSAALTNYAEKNGFDNLRFAVMTPELLSATSSAFGKSSLNPPSTPKIVVTSQGEASAATTGFESSAEILSKLNLAA